MGGMSGDIFNGADRLYIKQEMAAIELCGVEAKQRYRVSPATADNQEGQVFLYITEESGCLERICCSVNRSLKLLVHQGNSKDGPVVQTMDKPFSCQGCCCLRGSFVVNAGGNQIGSIEDPCRCCWMDLQVMNASGGPMFTAAGSPCQCGLCCPCCAGVKFDIAKEGQSVGSVEKMPADCQEIFLKTNRFIVDMTRIKDPVERRMALAAAMMLDLNYFEQQK